MKRPAGAIDKGLAEPEAEAAVLSLIASSEGEALGNPDICAELFFFPSHLLIFGAAKALFENGVKVDFRALTHGLNSAGQLANAGGASVISELFVRVPGSWRDH